MLHDTNTWSPTSWPPCRDSDSMLINEKISPLLQTNLSFYFKNNSWKGNLPTNAIIWKRVNHNLRNLHPFLYMKFIILFLYTYNSIIAASLSFLIACLKLIRGTSRLYYFLHNLPFAKDYVVSRTYTWMKCKKPLFSNWYSCHLY